MKPFIKHIRIDGRLIHGQVITKWIFTTKITRIIVIDDDVINNPIEKNALKISTPSNINLSILSVATASQNINNNKYEGQDVLILVKFPETLKQLSEHGVEMDSINVGNISQRDNTKQVASSIFLLPEDIEALQYLIDKGIDVYAQMIPSDPKKELSSLL